MRLKVSRHLAAVANARHIDHVRVSRELAPEKPVPDIRRVTDDFSVAPQLAPEDMAGLAGRFALVINNRPDGEETGQPCGEDVAQAARAAGLAYAAIPVTGPPGAPEVEAMRRAVSEASGPVLAYCRTGTRCIVTWALGEALQGRPSGELTRLGAEAGYDLAPPLQMLLPRLARP
jgi:uncharacterized protein (TIGR01244 family)